MTDGVDESSKRRRLATGAGSSPLGGGSPGTPAGGTPPPLRADDGDLPLSPPLRRLRTPDCMSSPVSHLRNLTRNMHEEARRVHAAQFLKESREQHLQQRRLFLVLDLDETLVHSLRSSVRHLPFPAAGASAAEAAQRCRVPGDEAGGAEAEAEEARANAAEEEKAAAVALALAKGSNSASSSAAASEDESEDESQHGAGGSDPAAPAGAPGPSSLQPPSLVRSGGGPPAGGGGGSDGQGGSEGEGGSEGVRSVTLTVQSVQFEMQLRPGVLSFLREMSSLFCVYLYTMGSREYVQQDSTPPRHRLDPALHHLDPEHDIFRPGQVLAWHPALDRTTKTLRRMLCHPHLVTIVDDSTIAWAQHLPNLLPIDRFTGDPADRSLARMAGRLRHMHAQFFAPQLAVSRHPLAPPASPAGGATRCGPAVPELRMPPPGTLPPGTVPPGPPKGPPEPHGGAVPPGHGMPPPDPPAAQASQASQASSSRPSPVRSSPLTRRSVSATDLDADPSPSRHAPPATAASRPPAREGPAPSSEPDPPAGCSSPPAPHPAPPLGEQSLAELARGTPPALLGHSSGTPPRAAEPATRDVRTIVRCMSENVLAGVQRPCVHCVFGGPADVLAGVARPPEVVLAERFGATIEATLSEKSTHLLLPPALLAPRALAQCRRTQEMLSHARSLGIEPTLHRVDLRWLLACVANWSHLPEAEWTTLSAGDPL